MVPLHKKADARKLFRALLIGTPDLGSHLNGIATQPSFKSSQCPALPTDSIPQRIADADEANVVWNNGAVCEDRIVTEL